MMHDFPPLQQMWAVLHHVNRFGLPLECRSPADPLWDHRNRRLHDCAEFALELPNGNEFCALFGQWEGGLSWEWFHDIGGRRQASWDEWRIHLNFPSWEFSRWLGRQLPRTRLTNGHFEFELFLEFMGHEPPELMSHLTLSGTQTLYSGHIKDATLIALLVDAVMGRIESGVAFDYFMDHHDHRLNECPF